METNVSDPDNLCGSGSESGPRQAKVVPKKGKNEENFMFEEFSFDLEGFWSCSQCTKPFRLLGAL
jgi:hypothetical protein